MKIPVRVRRGDAATWASKNPILGLGELGLETDTHKLKGGDGVTDWDSLPYISAGGGGGGNSWGDITGALSSQTDLQAALNAKAASSHNHAISDITGLQTALDGKANSSMVGLKVYVQNSEPSWGESEKALWIDTTGGNLNFWVQDGT